MSIIKYTILFLFAFAGVSQALTIKELVTVKGVQENELSGIGIVTGLQGTGDKKSRQKTEMILNILHNSDVDVSVTAEEMDTKNSALVIVTGRIPAFAGKGQPIELKVSAIGDAKSLKDGTLYFTKLSYPDHTAENPLTFATADGTVMQDEGAPLTSGKVRGIIQNEPPVTLQQGGKVRLLLKNPDFSDADSIRRQINQKFFKYTNKKRIAKAMSAGLIEVEIPEKFNDNAVGFIAEVEKIPVILLNPEAKVRINTRLKMVTFNEKVEVRPFAFTYKDLHIVVKGEPKRPENIDSRFVHLVEKEDPKKTDLKHLVDALNDMRVKPEDLVNIIQEVHKIGALQAELEID